MDSKSYKERKTSLFGNLLRRNDAAYKVYTGNPEALKMKYLKCFKIKDKQEAFLLT